MQTQTINYKEYYQADNSGFHPRLIPSQIICWILSLFPGVFHYDGRVYKRLSHQYNSTYQNSRSCEVPILMRLVKKYPANQVLEVGNVLRHYYPVKHCVVDLYDNGADEMADIAYWKPANGKKYGLIVSCSTLEHVGRDEAQQDPDKCVVALNNVLSLLAPGGLFVTTWGYNDNPLLEKYVESLPLKRCYMVGRDGARFFKSWRETDTPDAQPGEKVLCIYYYCQSS